MKSVWAVILAAGSAWGQSVYTGTWTSSGSGTLGSSGSDVFVAPASLGGSDSNPCTLAQPCLTPQHASSVVRGLPGGKHIVAFRGGTYSLSGTWTLNSGDSGSAATPIVYQNHGVESPVISGGRKVTGTWTVDSSVNCGSNCAAYYMDVDANPANQGHFVNVESLFYNGVRRPRPQKRSATEGYLTNACPGSNAAPMCVAGANLAAADTACGCPAGSGPCSFQSTPCSGGTPWMCFNKFMYNGADIDGMWHDIDLGDIELLAFEKWSMGRARLASAASGVAALTGPLSLSDGNSGCLPGYSYVVENVKEAAQKGQWYLDRCPSCTSSVALNWTPSTSSGVTGYNVYRGTTSGGPYTSVGSSPAGVFSYGDGTISHGITYYYVTTAVAGSTESAYSNEAAADIPPAVSAPTNTWRLYIYADTSLGEDPNTANVTVPALDPANPQLLTATGLQYVTFKGLTFQHDNWMPGQYGLGDSQGTPLVPAALSFADSSNITIDGTTVNHVQGWGIEFLGASASNQVVNSAAYDIGAGGIRIGLQAKTADTDSNVPRDNTVQNTAVAYYSRIQPTGEGPGIWLGDTHGNTITHNDIFGGYAGCIELGLGLKRGADDGSTTTQYFTYNNTVSWNHCYGQGSGGLFTGILSDFGGIYAASSLSANCPTTGQPTLTPSNTYCNHILYNRIHDLVHNYDNSNAQGAQGIYLDQGTSAMEVRFNLVYRISYSCALNNTPQHVGPNQNLSQWNLWENNIFAWCGAQQSNRQRVVARGGDNANSMIWRKNIGYYNSALSSFSNPQSSPGHWGCFADDGTTAVPCVNRFVFELNDWWNVAAGHGLSFSTCKTSACSGWPTNFNQYSALPWVGEDVGSINVNPLFVDPAYGADDWHLQADFSAIGFQTWDYTQAGRTSPTIAIPSNVPDLFPQRVVNAAVDY